MDNHALDHVGWSERVASLFDQLPGRVPARVVGIERGTARVVTPTGELTVRLTDFAVAVGDWVALDDDRLADLVPRWSQLERLGPEGARQTLAANVDVVLIAAPADHLSLTRVERELVVAWDSGARPVVVVTKTDLPGATAVVEELTARLGAADVISTSSVDGRGLDELRALLQRPVTAVLLGPSGAGKSRLVNAILGHDRQAVGEVREGDRRGRHTTTTRQLVPLPSGGSLIDMPGIRSLGTDASVESVAAAFDDIETLAEECRFADCAHDLEPGCAVTAAVAAGTLDPARFDSYRKLERELAQERRHDPKAPEPKRARPR
ncbi:MAG: ribosome small subunit-dependent GTPase A [Acidobacteria bacterium]|nr:ribosome small subunit-dependent GTPase A [Acidobacteriota bacterium]